MEKTLYDMKKKDEGKEVLKVLMCADSHISSRELNCTIIKQYVAKKTFEKLTKMQITQMVG